MKRFNESEKARRNIILGRKHIRESELYEDEDQDIEVEADATEDVADEEATEDGDVKSEIIALVKAAKAEGIITDEDLADEDFEDEHIGKSEEEPAAGIKGHMQLVGEKVVSKSECNQNESSQTNTKQISGIHIS